MAVSVTHAFVSAIPDGDDASLVRPSNWNDEHTVTGLGTAAEADTGDFATAAQGTKADSALQPSAIGSTVQAFDADLSSWAGVTRASGFDTFAATPSSANLRSLLTDESGSGAALFAGTGGANIANTPAGNIAATDVQSAINELDTEKAGLALSNVFSVPQEIAVTTNGVVNQPFTVTREVTVSNSGPTVAMQRARTGPAAVQLDDRIGELGANGYSGSGYPSTIPFVIRMFSTETWSGSANGTRCEFLSTLTGTVTRAARLTIEGSGLVTLPSGLGRGAPVTKTADFTVALGENWIINNKSGSACSVTLPSASSFTGREISFKNIQAQQLNSASSNVVPLGTAVAGTAILTANAGRWATLVSDGTNWIIMQGVV